MANIINEPGLYRLLSRSNKKRAKIIMKKIPSEILRVFLAAEVR
jgi:prophage antirepressor-like protein